MRKLGNQVGIQLANNNKNEATTPVRPSHVAAALVATAILGAGYLFGYTNGVTEANTRLPNCQEDEYLYPVHDYEGPGKNNTSEYGCVHLDSIRDL